MRMLLNVRIPHEPFNTLVKEGRAGEIIRRILDDLKPESIVASFRLKRPTTISFGWP